MRRHHLILLLALIALLGSALAFNHITKETPKVISLSLDGIDVSPAGISGTQELFTSFPLGQPQTIYFSYPDNAEGEMTPRTKRDQARDWLLYTAVSNSNLSDASINEILFDLPPVRYGYCHELGSLSFGTVRSSFLRDQDIVVIVPAGSDTQQKDDIAHAVDLQRMNLGDIPRRVHFFTYRLSQDLRSAELTRQPPIAGEDLFTPAYGYVQRTIRSKGDFADFMAEAQDLTYVHTDEELTLGGRTLQNRKFRNIRVEDVAAIYQAIDKQNTELAAFEYKWGNQTYRTEAEKNSLIQQMQEEQLALGLTEGTGFSLDPAYNFSGLSQELSKYREWIQPAAFQRMIVGLASENIVPFLEEMERLRDASVLMDQMVYKLLHHLESTNKFQAARYDGDLEGTEVGMILFYTDLLAKLWGMNYKYTAPEFYVPEFLSDIKVKLGIHYEEESAAYPSARLWFGPNSRGYGLSDDDKLVFARNASRIFAAGSNPLNPGKEVAISAFFGASLNWWNNHYEEVAAYETMYEALNEIIKWSVAINYLNQENDRKLSFLKQVPVARDNWFPDWVKQHPELRFDLWRSINFYPKGQHGTKTEALPILYSPTYISNLSGREGIISGGVSLANKTVLKSVRPVSKIKSPALRRANIRGNLADEAVIVLDKGPRFRFVSVAENPRLTITPRADAKMRNVFSEVNNREFTRTVKSNPTEKIFETRMAGNLVGELHVAKTPNGFMSGFRSRSVDRGMHLARQISESSNPTQLFRSNNKVAAFLEGPDRQFLIRLKGETDWIHMELSSRPKITLEASWDVRSSSPRVGSSTVRERWVNQTTAKDLASGWNKTLPETTNLRFSQNNVSHYQRRNPEQLVDDALRNPRQGYELKVDRQNFIKESFSQIDDQIARQSNYNQLRSHLDELAKIVGETPDISLRRAMIELNESSQVLKEVGINRINNLSAASIREPGKRARFLNEAVEKINTLEGVSPLEKNRLTTLVRDRFDARAKIFEADGISFPSKARNYSHQQLAADLEAGNVNRVYMQRDARLNNIDFNGAPRQVMEQIMELHPDAVVLGMPKHSLAGYSLEGAFPRTASQSRLSPITLNYRHLDRQRGGGALNCVDDSDPDCQGIVYYIYLPEAS